MSSQNEETFFELIRKLPEWSTQEVEENLAHTLSVLLRILECPDQKALSLQAVQALLNRCLPCIPVNDVEQKLFQYVLPSTQNLFNEALAGIQIRLQDVQNPQEDELLESLNSLLQVCIELLKCIDYTLHYVLRVGKVEATLIPSLPKVTVSILYEAFKHCKESEKKYGTLFQALGDVLTTLFHKSRELQLRFLEILSDNLQFKCVYEDELILLTEILDTLGQISQLVVGLDVKTMAEQWKGYARLAFQYVEHLKPRLDVAGPLQFLATDVSHSLKKVIEMDQPDLTFLIRTVKVGSFSLKIIIKFCDLYNGYLGSCHQELFQMLLAMYRYSRPYLQMQNVPEEIIQNVETHLTIGAEPLLTHLVSEVEFTEKFIAYGNKLVEPQSDRLAFLLLSVSILRKLLHCSSDVRKLWLSCDPESNILSILFRALSHCHAELSWDLHSVSIRQSGEPERMMDLYETIVTHVAGFILSASVQEFLSVEQILLESIMQPDVWRALLAMDIWCILARSGTTELCFQQLCHLVEVMKHLAYHHGRPEKTYLMVLNERLFSLLPNKHKMLMTEKFPPHRDPFVWQALSVKVLPDKLRATVTDSLLKSAISNTEKFLTLPASVDLYNPMVDALASAAQCVETLTQSQRDLLSPITNHVVTLWQRVAFNEVLTVEETSVKGSHWMEHFLSVLCTISAALVLQMNNSQLLKVLERLKNITTCGSSTLRLKTVTILNRLANKVIDSTPDQMKVFHNIAGLFSTLLQDENQLVQQMTFEVFTYFAHVNCHESILALSVRNNANLQQQTRRYLQKLAINAPDKNLLSYEAYIECQSQVHFSHRCKTSVNAHAFINSSKVSSGLEFSALDEAKSVDHLSKRPKLTITEDNVIKAIERLKNDSNMVSKYCETNSLFPEAKQDILKIAIQLKELC